MTLHRNYFNGDRVIPGVYDGHTEVVDYWLRHAIDVIFSEYGDRVSVSQKSKDLLKFGRNDDIDTSPTTIMTLPSGVANETYVSSNLITTIISTDAGDTQDLIVEGHTSDDGLTFSYIEQPVTLNGQNEVTLTTPLARCSDAYNDDNTNLAGTISVTEDDTFSSGVPDTPAGVHLQIKAGKQNAEKASTTLASTDYWIVTGFYGDILQKSAAFADISLEIRQSGKVFREFVDVSATDGSRAQHTFIPYLIVPKNADVRLQATANASNTALAGGIQGVLATINT